MMRCLALVLMMPSASFACAVAEAFHPADLAYAPVVIVGEVTGYAQDPATSVGTFSLQVTEVMKGEAPAELKLEWWPMMAEWPPEAWDRATNVIVAAEPPQGEAGWKLALEVCGSVWLLPDTPDNRSIVMDAIKVQS